MTLLRITAKVVLGDLNLHFAGYVTISAFAKELLLRLSAGTYGKALNYRHNHRWTKYENTVIEEEHSTYEVLFYRMLFREITAGVEALTSGWPSQGGENEQVSPSPQEGILHQKPPNPHI